MYAFFKPFLFWLSPEKAHRISVGLLDIAAAFWPTRIWMKALFSRKNTQWEKQVAGLRFPNPVGLAAGFDKDGKHIAGLALLGFGFIEVGTVTPVAQEGNPRPRLFRLPADRALINRMGFNNEGLEALVGRLKKWRAKGPSEALLVGGNIGKNKSTPNEKATEDYIKCFDALYEYVDYFVVNVSSPNTPNLRELQEKEPLTRLLGELQNRPKQKEKPKPILLKIAPDLTNEQLEDIAEIVDNSGIAGLIATNTTVARTGLNTDPTEIEQIGAGGLSGAPLAGRSTEVIRFLRQKLGNEALIIGVGGIDSPESARQKLDAGADLIQVYTGMIYEGPGLIRRILQSL